MATLSIPSRSAHAFGEMKGSNLHHTITINTNEMESKSDHMPRMPRRIVSPVGNRLKQKVGNGDGGARSKPSTFPRKPSVPAASSTVPPATHTTSPRKPKRRTHSPPFGQLPAIDLNSADGSAISKNREKSRKGKGEIKSNKSKGNNRSSSSGGSKAPRRSSLEPGPVSLSNHKAPRRSSLGPGPLSLSNHKAPRRSSLGPDPLSLSNHSTGSCRSYSSDSDGSYDDDELEDPLIKELNSCQSSAERKVTLNVLLRQMYQRTTVTKPEERSDSTATTTTASTTKSSYSGCPKQDDDEANERSSSEHSETCEFYDDIVLLTPVVVTLTPAGSNSDAASNPPLRKRNNRSRSYGGETGTRSSAAAARVGPNNKTCSSHARLEGHIQTSIGMYLKETADGANPASNTRRGGRRPGRDGIGAASTEMPGFGTSMRTVMTVASKDSTLSNVSTASSIESLGTNVRNQIPWM